jgi:phosphoribulokinase
LLINVSSECEPLFSERETDRSTLLRYGNKFVKRCRSYLHAEEEAVELLLAIESNWAKMETQIEILGRIARSLNKRLQDMQSQVAQFGGLTRDAGYT